MYKCVCVCACIFLVFMQVCMYPDGCEHVIVCCQFGSGCLYGCMFIHLCVSKTTCSGGICVKMYLKTCVIICAYVCLSVRVLVGVVCVWCGCVMYMYLLEGERFLHRGSFVLFYDELYLNDVYMT